MARSWPASSANIEVCDHLAPGGGRRKLARFLRDRALQRVALVGHEPDLSQLVAWLIGSKKASIKLGKGGAAYLRSDNDIGKGSCTLVWLMTQEWLRG
jgi:phosphohistidine phosphatase